MSLEAKARVREHVRKIQSSAKSGAAAAVRPEPASTFQAPPQNLPRNSPSFENPIDAEAAHTRNGLDYS